MFSVGVLRSVSVQGWLAADTVQATRLARSLLSACREQIRVLWSVVATETEQAMRLARSLLSVGRDSSWFSAVCSRLVLCKRCGQPAPCSVSLVSIVDVEGGVHAGDCASDAASPLLA